MGRGTLSLSAHFVPNSKGSLIQDCTGTFQVQVNGKTSGIFLEVSVNIVCRCYPLSGIPLHTVVGVNSAVFWLKSGRLSFDMVTEL